MEILDMMRLALEQMPANRIQLVHTIKINPAPYKNALATVGGRKNPEGIIDFYPAAIETGTATQTLAHELGHLVNYDRWKTFIPEERWAQAMQLDRAKFSSKYAKSFTENEAGGNIIRGAQEDFPEAFANYIMNDGGMKTGQFNDWGTVSHLTREDMSRRFAILDEILQANPLAKIEYERMVARIQYLSKAAAAGAGIGTASQVRTDGFITIDRNDGSVAIVTLPDDQ